jgi:hypothetical protein
VDRHSGTLSLTSGADGTGTVAQITIPAALPSGQ